MTPDTFAIIGTIPLRSSKSVVSYRYSQSVAQGSTVRQTIGFRVVEQVPHGWLAESGGEIGATSFQPGEYVHLLSGTNMPTTSPFTLVVGWVRRPGVTSIEVTFGNDPPLRVEPIDEFFTLGVEQDRASIDLRVFDEMGQLLQHLEFLPVPVEHLFTPEQRQRYNL